MMLRNIVLKNGENSLRNRLTNSLMFSKIFLPKLRDAIACEMWTQYRDGEVNGVGWNLRRAGNADVGRFGGFVTFWFFFDLKWKKKMKKEIFDFFIKTWRNFQIAFEFSESLDRFLNLKLNLTYKCSHKVKFRQFASFDNYYK